MLLKAVHEDVRRDCVDEAGLELAERLAVISSGVRVFANTLAEKQVDIKSKINVSDVQCGWDWCRSYIRENAKSLAESTCADHLQIDQIENQGGLVDDVTSDILQFAEMEVVKPCSIK